MKINNYFDDINFTYQNWEAKKDNFKARFPKLTDLDLVYDSDEPQAMIDKLKRTLGMSSDELSITILSM